MPARKNRKESRVLLQGRILAFCFALLCAPALHGDVIDRLMALVDGKIITLSDVKQERALRQFFGEESPQEDAAILDEVIEDFLIRNQVDQFPGIQVTTEEVESYRLQLGDAGDLAGEVVDVTIRQRMKLARYVDLRFRQFIQASETEIEQYYSDVFLPRAQTSGLRRIPPLEEVRETIRTNVIEEEVDREIRVWVESLVRRSEIEVVE